jgi:hypothetical protein
MVAKEKSQIEINPKNIKLKYFKAHQDLMMSKLNKIYLITALGLLGGCGDSDSLSKVTPMPSANVASATAPIEKEPKTNYESNNTSPTLVPKFLLACSYGSQSSPKNYRFVSDGGEVYFGHENGSAFSKSKKLTITDRLISFVQAEPSGVIYSSNIITEIHRDSLKIWVTRLDFTGKDEQQLYICDAMNSDDALIDLIKSDFEAKRQKSLDERRAYEARPNKI